MAASDRRRARAMLAIAASIGVTVLAACNGILGIDKFYDSTDGGPTSDANGSDVITQADGSIDSSTQDGATDAGIDQFVVTLPEGSAPVSFARWKMPDPTPGAANAPSYVAVDGGVLDQVTGLVWMPGKLTCDGTFEGAKAACDGAPNGPWRLPTRIELISLLELVTDAGVARTSPFLDTTVFVAMGQGGPFWTSSPHLPITTNPPAFWAVDFGTGLLITTDVQSPSFVRCVKGTGG